MVDFVDGFGQVYSTQIDSTAIRDISINILLDCINCMRAAVAFLKTKLVRFCSEKQLKGVHKAMLKEFGNDRAYRDTAVVITC